MSASVQFSNLSFDKLLEAGKVIESERGAFLLGVATGIGWAVEQFPGTSQFKQIRDYSG